MSWVCLALPSRPRPSPRPVRLAPSPPQSRPRPTTFIHQRDADATCTSSYTTTVAIPRIRSSSNISRFWEKTSFSQSVIDHRVYYVINARSRFIKMNCKRKTNSKQVLLNIYNDPFPYAGSSGPDDCSRLRPIRAHDLSLAHLRRVINLYTYLLPV